MNRRSLLKSGLTLTGTSVLTSGGYAKNIFDDNIEPNAIPLRRKLGGKLEVSSIGLGVQNMHRTYQTTIPSRPEMINIIRKAYDKGVTLFDTAEAYGPWQCEKILICQAKIVQSLRKDEELPPELFYGHAKQLALKQL